MSIRRNHNGEVKELLADAARWRLLSLFFQRPRPGQITEMEKLALEAGDEELASLVSQVDGFSEADYLALLGPGGSVSPREVGYRPFADPGRLLADLQAFYQAFAYSPRSEDPLDHVSYELDFLAFLRTKQAYARLQGKQPQERLMVEAVEKFVERHLGEFSSRFAEKLAKSGPQALSRAAEKADQQIQWLAQLVTL